jgi:TIGR03009 family protein
VTQAPLGTFLRQVRRLAGTEALQALTDAQLLQRFARQREESAFAILLQRHGRLVWGVCQRVLRHEQDAEDAFQAAFLALARHAPSIRAGVAVASWLYRVAYRVAVRAGADRARRRAREREANMRPLGDPHADLAWSELRAVLDEELCRLPEKYQAPFVLCCLEGKSKPEAARELGWKEGTLSGRLAEARRLLRCRLDHRGVTLAAALTAVLARQSAAAVRPHLLTITARAASLYVVGAETAAGLVSAHVAVLAEGVSKTMRASRVKLAAVLVLVGGILAGGSGMMTQRAPGAQEAEEPPAEESKAEPVKSKTAPAPEPPAAPELDRLDVVLLRWQKAMEKVQTAVCQVRRTDHNRTFEYTDVFEGTFKYMKPRLYVLELQKRGDSQTAEKFMSDGKQLYQYRMKEKEVVAHELPPAGWMDELPRSGFLGSMIARQHQLLLGMKAEDARRLYDLKLIKEDKWYIYLSINPRLPDEMASLQEARLVLRKESFLPRQYWFRAPNGDEHTWDIPKLEIGVKLEREGFAAKVPPGWRLVQMPPEKDPKR